MKKGFTMIEMLIVMAIIMTVLLLVIPNVTNKHNTIKDRGCDALLEVINSQILMYEISNGELPSSVSELVPDFLNEKQTVCPNGDSISIVDGQAVN